MYLCLCANDYSEVTLSRTSYFSLRPLSEQSVETLILPQSGKWLGQVGTLYFRKHSGWVYSYAQASGAESKYLMKPVLSKALPYLPTEDMYVFADPQDMYVFTDPASTLPTQRRW